MFKNKIYHLPRKTNNDTKSEFLSSTLKFLLRLKTLNDSSLNLRFTSKYKKSTKKTFQFYLTWKKIIPCTQTPKEFFWYLSDDGQTLCILSLVLHKNLEMTMFVQIQMILYGKNHMWNLSKAHDTHVR